MQGQFNVTNQSVSGEMEQMPGWVRKILKIYGFLLITFALINIAFSLFNNFIIVAMGGGSYFLLTKLITDIIYIGGISGILLGYGLINLKKWTIPFYIIDKLSLLLLSLLLLGKSPSVSILLILSLIIFGILIYFKKQLIGSYFSLSSIIIIIIVLISNFYAVDLIKNTIKETGSDPWNSDSAYNKADMTGNYSDCTSLPAKDRQFCLWLAAGESNDIKICQLMSKDLYSTDRLYSQHSCFTSYAYKTNNKTSCNNIPEEKECLAGFKEMETNREICGPKDIKDTRQFDCRTAIYADQSLSKCEQLLPKGQAEVDNCKAYIKSMPGFNPVTNK